MACTPAAVISRLTGAALLLAACGSGSGTPDAGAADADTTDARPTPDAPVDAVVFDALIPPQGATCEDPIPLAPGDSTTADTTLFAAALTAPCSLGSSTAREGKFAIDLGETPRDLVVNVEVDEQADPPFDAVVYAYGSCGTPETALGCADAGWSERLDVLAASGVVYVIVDGTFQHGGAREGAFTISTAARDIVAENGSCDPAGVTSRCADGFRCIGGTCAADSPEVACAQAVTLDVSTGSASVTATTFAYAADHYDGSCAYDPDEQLPEHIYAVTVPAGADLVASTDDPLTDFDTYVYMRAGGCTGGEVACNDDVDTQALNLKSTLTASNLAAGTYYLFVDGSSNSPGTGTYRLSVTVTP